MSDADVSVFVRPRGAVDISQRQLLDAQNALSSILTDCGASCINLCNGRYGFTLGFSAALLAKMTTLLPANRQPETIWQVATQYPGCVLLHDESLEPALLEQLQTLGIRLIDLANFAAEHDTRLLERPQIPAQQRAAIVFTSGSTGQPKGICKTWGTLAGTAALLQDRFLPRQCRPSIVATVPPQHMYGLEMTVMLALQGGCCVNSGRLFYPTDIVQALADMPPPRLLVTTPIHMKALLQSELVLPEMHSVISATAPLTHDLASRAEAAWACPVKEIYGCSEAGSLASRRTTDGSEWLTLEGVVLERRNDAAVVSAAHLSEPVILQDKLDISAPDRFRFLGRGADMLNIGGKRASLQQLTAQLLAVEGVRDAIVFVRADGTQKGDSGRPAALVVSDRPLKAIRRELLLQIDPVFLPRPLKKANVLPRNAVGKCTQQALLEALENIESGEQVIVR